jgi:hypothetical protein
MTQANYSAMAAFSVSAVYIQASSLPPTKPVGNNLSRVQNLLSAAQALAAADSAMLARVTPPTGGKQYLFIQSAVAWTALSTVIETCQTLIGGQTGLSQT